MALTDIYNVWSAQGGPLLSRFIGACLKSAYAIANEDGGTDNHANRLLWADDILKGDEATVRARATEILRYAAGSNATLQSSGEAATDNDIEYIVASLIDTFATGA